MALRLGCVVQTDPEFEAILALHRLLDRHETLETTLLGSPIWLATSSSASPMSGSPSWMADRPSTAAATDSETYSARRSAVPLGRWPVPDRSPTGRSRWRSCRSAEDDRWPEFNRGGARPRRPRGRCRCQLEGEAPSARSNLYSNTIGPFDETDRQRAASFAEQASIALANALSFTRVAEMTEQLREALATRDVIGQAKGILMARHTITADEAFDRLRTTSQLQNRKLRAIAEDVARTGELPEA